MDDEELARAFEGHRPHLLALAARTLGSMSDAEDAVQEAWFRLKKHADDPIDNLGGWLTRVVGRICIDTLRSRTTRPKATLDDWADSLVVTEDDDGPEETALAADTLGLALLVVFQTLRPEERLAFVLHDVFAVPFSEIGPIVGCSTDAAKMLASRARRKVRQSPTPTGDRRQRREVVDAFLVATREGDFEGLLELLDPDLRWHRFTPHGHTVTIGANEVLSALRTKSIDRVEARRVNVNGEPGILVWGPSGRPIALMSCTVVDGRLAGIVSVLDPARLARMTLPARARVANVD